VQENRSYPQGHVDQLSSELSFAFAHAENAPGSVSKSSSSLVRKLTKIDAFQWLHPSWTEKVSIFHGD
jgi:hypothetical protein